MDGLIIKKEWLDLILDGKKDSGEKKPLEVRNSPNKKSGPIALIESRSGMVKGTCTIGPSFCMSDKTFKKLKEKHFVERPFYKKNYAWPLSNAKRLKKPVPYKHPQGAVKWVKDVL
jgi:hypothetical protein